jgi:zinc-binding alcohol dehydrogenase/oxidoreductase
MKAMGYQLKAIKTNLELEEFSIDHDKEEQALVELMYSSINRRDYYISMGQYAQVVTPVVLGSDGMGTYKNTKVLINPSLNWIENQLYQPKDYKILGMPSHGTFASHVLVPQAVLHPKPTHLEDYECAALPLAGLTAYRVLIEKCSLTSKDHVLVTGAGGGVSTFVIQFAKALGAKITLTTGSQTKIDFWKKYGIHHCVNYKDTNWTNQLKEISPNGFDVIIDSAGGSILGDLLPLASMGARIGIYGGTLGKTPNFSPQILFWKQLTLMGSTMGSHQDFKNMLSFVSQYKIHPIVDEVLPISQIPTAFEKMKNHDQVGKIVFSNTF